MEAEQLVDAGLDRRTGLPELASIVQVGGCRSPCANPLAYRKGIEGRSGGGGGGGGKNG